MEFFEVIQNRYSVRSYKSEPIEQEKLNRVLEAARLAPTAANRQPFRFIVIKTSGNEEALRKIYHREWFCQAPLVIAVVAVFGEAWSRMDGKNYAEVDATIAMDHLILAAHNEGLGTCWVAAFNPEEARRFLNLPDNVEPIAFTPLGYPKDSPRIKKRKELNELVFYDRWQ